MFKLADELVGRVPEGVHPFVLGAILAKEKDAKYKALADARRREQSERAKADRRVVK